MKRILTFILAFALGAFVLFSPVSEVVAQTDADTTVETEEFDWDAWEAEFDAAYDDTSYDYGDDYYYDDYSSISDEDAAALAIFTGVYLVVVIVFSIFWYVYMGLTLMTIAKKLNHESPWLAWIPLANIYLMVKLADLSGWMMLLMFVPLVNIGLAVYIWMKMAERRGFEMWLGILMIVPIAQLIIPGYLAWAEPKTVAKK